MSARPRSLSACPGSRSLLPFPGSPSERSGARAHPSCPGASARPVPGIRTLFLPCDQAARSAAPAHSGQANRVPFGVENTMTCPPELLTRVTSAGRPSGAGAAAFHGGPALPGALTATLSAPFQTQFSATPRIGTAPQSHAHAVNMRVPAGITCNVTWGGLRLRAELPPLFPTSCPRGSNYRPSGVVVARSTGAKAWQSYGGRAPATAVLPAWSALPPASSVRRLTPAAGLGDPPPGSRTAVGPVSEMAYRLLPGISPNQFALSSRQLTCQLIRVPSDSGAPSAGANGIDVAE